MGKFDIGKRVHDGEEEGVIISKRKGQREVRYLEGFYAGLEVWQNKSDLTAVPLRLEYGKSYVDRSGYEHGPLIENYGSARDTHPFRSATGGRSWRDDGAWLDEGDVFPEDLVAEVVAATAAPSEEKGEVAFQIGDKARLTRDGRNAFGTTISHFKAGDVVTLKSVMDGLETAEREGWTGFGVEGSFFWVRSDDIEPYVEAAAGPVKVEIGKFYVDREGTKSGPIIANTGMWDSTHPFTAANEVKSWRADGTFSADTGETCAWDLVAEWVEPAWQPKAGDRVRWTEKFKSSLYTKDGIYTIGRAGEEKDWFHLSDNDSADRHPSSWHHSWDAAGIVEHFEFVDHPAFMVGDKVQYSTTEPAYGARFTTATLTVTRVHHDGDVDVLYPQHATPTDRSDYYQIASRADLKLATGPAIGTIVSGEVVSEDEDGRVAVKFGTDHVTFIAHIPTTSLAA